MPRRSKNVKNSNSLTSCRSWWIRTRELSAALKDFQAKQLEVQAKQMMGEQVGPEVMQQIQELSQIMMRDPLTAQYLQAQMRFSLMMNDVYKILGEVMGLGNLQ